MGIALGRQRLGAAALATGLTEVAWILDKLASRLKRQGTSLAACVPGLERRSQAPTPGCSFGRHS